MEQKQHIVVLNSDGTVFAEDHDVVSNVIGLLAKHGVAHQVYYSKGCVVVWLSA